MINLPERIENIETTLRFFKAQVRQNKYGRKEIPAKILREL